MRSIRFSLIVYFLLLIAVTLGAISYLVYRSSSQMLHANHERTIELLREKHERKCKEVRAAFDRRILRRAQTLASLGRRNAVHYEAFFFLGAIGGSSTANGHLSTAVWLSESMHPQLSVEVYRLLPNIHIQDAEAVMASGKDEAEEFFQTYEHNGVIQERSLSMQETRFHLDEDLRDEAKLLKEHFDDVELRPGLTVRRVTLKTTVPGFGRWFPNLWQRSKWFRRRAKAKKGPFPAPRMFIQFGSSTAHLQATLKELDREHEAEVAQLKNESKLALSQLRTRLLWIGLATFVAVVAGGLWLVALGLLPLRRLSDAVSRVSEKDFRLDIDEKNFSAELQPIVRRLTKTLSQLERAFNREKQSVADISHELRTPLAALLTTLDVGLRKERSPQEYRELLTECRESSQQISQLVERLLALARIDAGSDTLRPTRLDVADLATQCAKLVRPLAAARDVELNLHVESTPVWADPDKLREILNNLLHNAIQYNRPNGRIDVRVEHINGSLHLEVADTGIGISPADQEHIFERFYRADPSRHADGLHAGIGLAVVKSYVDLMGGDIQVQSSSEGSTFSCLLPLAKERTTSSQAVLVKSR